MNHENYHTPSVPRHDLEREADLEARFLGNDLTEICEAAADSRFAVIIATAGLPLPKRKEALKIWRAEKIKSVLKTSIAAQTFMQNGDPEIVQPYRDGDRSLAEFREAIHAHITEERQKEIDARRQVKAKLRNVLHSLIRDIMPKHDEKTEPRWMLVLPCGELSFWRYEREAKKYANATGEAYFLLAFEPKRSQIRPPRGSDWIETEGFSNEERHSPVPYLGLDDEEVEEEE